jgi:hypothetical protein
MIRKDTISKERKGGDTFTSQIVSLIVLWGNKNIKGGNYAKNSFKG